MRTRTVIIAVVLVAVVTVPVAVGYLLLRGMDLNAYRPQGTALAKTWTGRDLQIEGDLQVGLHRGLVIRAAGLSLSNTAWGSRPQMLTAGRAEARLALLPLLQGELRVTTVVLHDVDILLESNAAGEHNWHLEGRSAGAAKATPAFPSVSIVSGRATWRRTGSEPLGFTDVQLDADGDDGTYKVRASARLDGQRLKLHGHLPLARTLLTGKPEPVDLRVEYGETTLTGRGTVQQAPWGLGLNLKVDAKADDLQGLRRLTGWPLAGLPAVELTADVSRSADGWRLAELDVEAGPHAFKGDLRIPADGGRPKLSGALTSPHVDLTSDESSGTALWDSMQEALSAETGGLTALDAALQLRIDRLVYGDRVLEKVEADGQLSDGRLTVDPIKADVAAGGHAEGRFQWAAGNGQPEWQLGAKLRGVSTGVLLGPVFAENVRAPLDLVLDLKTRGLTGGQAMANLSGEIRLLAGAGRARLKSFESMVSGVRTLTGLFIAEKSDDAQLNCAVADFHIEDGVARSKVLLIDSAASTVRGDGQVDLGARQIDLTLTPKAKHPSLNVAVPVHVRGSLEAPEVVADRKSMVGKVLGVAGVFVFPPAAVATLGELGSWSNPCIQLLKEQAAQ